MHLFCIEHALRAFRTNTNDILGLPITKLPIIKVKHAFLGCQCHRVCSSGYLFVVNVICFSSLQVGEKLISEIGQAALRRFDSKPYVHDVSVHLSQSAVAGENMSNNAFEHICLLGV